MSDVTRILAAIERGDPRAAEQLLPLVYDELRKLAAAEAGPGEARPDAAGDGAGARGLSAAGGRRQGAALGQPRALLCRRGRGDAADPGRQCPPQAATQARRRPPAGRTGSAVDLAGRTPGPTNCWRWTRRSTNWPANDRQTAELVKLRYFAGLTIEQAAELLGILRATADRHWAYARAWLARSCTAIEVVDEASRKSGGIGRNPLADSH